MCTPIPLTVATGSSDGLDLRDLDPAVQQQFCEQGIDGLGLRDLDPAVQQFCEQA